MRSKRIIWMSYLFLDLLLHKTSRIEILEHLAKRGHDVSLVAIQSKGKFEMKGTKLKIISIPWRYASGISAVLHVGLQLVALPYYIVRLKPDIIVTEPGMSILGFAWAPALSIFKRPRFVLDIRSTPVETVGFHGRLENFFFSVSVLFAKLFFSGMTTITEPMKKELCAKFNVSEKFVGVWTSGVSEELFNPEKYIDDSLALRKKLGLDEKFIVLYHGNFGVRRGIVDCVKGVSLLKGEFSDLVLFLLGKGPASEEIRKTIAANGIQDKIVVHDPVDYREVPKYIAMCDVGIIPLPDLADWRNQCPLKLLELLSMEKAVILTDIPAHREVLGDCECGIYMTGTDAKAVAEAVTYAYKSRSSLRVLGSLGKTIVEEKYTWDIVAKDFDEYLDRLYTNEW